MSEKCRQISLSSFFSMVSVATGEHSDVTTKRVLPILVSVTVCCCIEASILRGNGNRPHCLKDSEGDFSVDYFLVRCALVSREHSVLPGDVAHFAV